MEQLGLRDHRWHLDFLSYPPRHTALFHPASPVWRFLPRHQHSATSEPKKRLANRWSRSGKRATVWLVESKSSDRWLTAYPGMRIYYISLWSWDSHQLYCYCENIFFFCFDFPIFKKLTQRTEMFETTHWYFHISIVSLHQKEKKTTTQLLRPMVATTVHLTENLFMF